MADGSAYGTGIYDTGALGVGRATGSAGDTSPGSTPGAQDRATRIGGLDPSGTELP